VKVDFYICPSCGTEVRVGSKTCAKCASERATKKWGAVEERKPWEQAETYDGLDLPDDEFDYAKFLEEEFGSAPKRSGKEWFWWSTAVLLLAVMAWFFVSALR
jgi:hypothetical protein